jgi:hypothetical protein
MDKGISFQGFVPMRREPSHASEMGSQLMFGETFRILETGRGWRYISLDFDGFEGWVGADSIQPFESDNRAEKEPEDDIRVVTLPSVSVLDLERARPLILPAGSLWKSISERSMTIQGRHFEVQSEEGLVIPGKDADPEEIGQSLLSIPGIHGGRSGFGFDGPGLVQMICRAMGIALPRDCTAQSDLGTTINFMHEISKGDLAFFDNKEGVITHVGIVLGAGRILHAWDQVRIDKLDQQGIYCAEKEDYTHKLRIIKRIEGT